ncbi:unnamed protein product, partial [Symbiodinium pilosum]
MATKASVVAFALSAVLLLYFESPGSLAGNPLLPRAAVDFPMVVFFMFFFFGHRLTLGVWSPSLWLDKLCICQSDEDGKAEAISALPEFVRRSSRMLILWDETYFERLWCNLEIAIFVKSHNSEAL